MYSIRQEQMREYIEKKNVVTIKELQALFPNVSLMTIHRDLDALELQGAVVKFRGGAKSVKLAGDPEFNVRMRENNPGKQIIAQKALELIQPHTSIFLDASTTNVALAQQLPDISSEKRTDMTKVIMTDSMPASTMSTTSCPERGYRS